MTQPSASASIKLLIVIISLAAMPAVSFAQTTGGATGSTGGVTNASPPPGTNSLGTAQSSGANTAPGVTTGAASGANRDADATVSAENRQLDKKMNSICRGC